MLNFCSREKTLHGRFGTLGKRWIMTKYLEQDYYWMFCFLFSLAMTVVQKKCTSEYLILIKKIKKGNLWFRLKVGYNSAVITTLIIRKNSKNKSTCSTVCFQVSESLLDRWTTRRYSLSCSFDDGDDLFFPKHSKIYTRPSIWFMYFLNLGKKRVEILQNSILLGSCWW